MPLSRESRSRRGGFEPLASATLRGPSEHIGTCALKLHATSRIFPLLLRKRRPHCPRRLALTDPAFVELCDWPRHSEELTQERVRLANRMPQQLWRYCPQFLDAVGDDVAAPWAVNVRRNPPTPRWRVRVPDRPADTTSRLHRFDFLSRGHRRLDHRRRAAGIGVLDARADDRARLQFHRAFGLVGQMGATVPHLRARPLGALPRRNARRRSQFSQGPFLALAGVPAHDAPQHSIRLQGCPVNTDRPALVALDEVGVGHPLQHPREDRLTPLGVRKRPSTTSSSGLAAPVPRAVSAPIAEHPHYRGSPSAWCSLMATKPSDSATFYNMPLT